REQHRHGLLLDREFVAQLEDESHPRDIDLAEAPRARRAFRPHPVIRDPPLELVAIEAGDAHEQALDADHAPSIAFRGSNALPAGQSRRNPSSASSAGPIATRNST